jgi:hypothetical protein
MGTLRIQAKCSDLCFSTYLNNKGKVLAEKDGYVPQGLNISDDSDYVEIDIDIQTGQIQRWKPLTEKQVIETLNKKRS